MMSGPGRMAELVRFGMLSVASAVVTLGLPILLHEQFGTDPRVAVAVAYLCAFAGNFVVMRFFVFRHSGNAAASLGRFAVSSLVFRGAEYAAFLLLFRAGMVYYLAQFIVVGVSFGVKFLTMRHIVFKPSPVEPQS